MNSNQKNIPGRRHGASRLLALFLFLGAVGFALPAKSATFEEAGGAGKGRTLDTTMESCLANNAIDPGETNTVSFKIKNTTGADLTEVKVTLKSGGIVDFSLEGQKTIGNVAKDAEFTVTFRFRATGTCGIDNGVATLKIDGKQGGNVFTAVDVAYGGFQLGATVSTTYSYSNTGNITIPHTGKASPYPSSITVPNGAVPNNTDLTGEQVKKVSVTLRGLTHTYSRDVNALLIGPGDKKIVLMRESGGATTASSSISGVDLTFTQGAGSTLPVNAQIVSGTFKPSDHAPGTPFPDEPAGTYVTDLNAAFTDTNVQGQWRLYVYDDQSSDSGNISNGWTISFETTKIVCCGAGQTFPVITQGADPDKKAGIANVEIAEDAPNGDADHPTPVPNNSFQVSDLDGGTLTVTATSSDQSILTDSNIVITADGSTRTFKIKRLVAHANGTTVITVTVTDAQGNATVTQYNLKVNAVNDKPVIGTILNQSINKGAQSAPIPFTVSDVESSADNVIITAESDNQTLVPNANIFFGGTGANRTVTVIPANATDASAKITLTARDPGGETSTKEFIVNFNTEPGDPTITPISSPTTTKEDESKSIAIALKSNSSTAVSNLGLGATSSNPGLVPAGNIQFTGSGADRTVVITPVANATGNSTIRITVTDTGNNRSSFTEFVFTVTPVNDEPTISTVATTSINEDSLSGEIGFTIGDTETAAADLIVTAVSSAADVVPNETATSDSDDGIRLGGTGSNRTIRIRPTNNANGKTIITLRVTDTGHGTEAAKIKESTFTLFVDAINDAPTVATVNAGAVSAGDANNDSITPIITINEDAGLTFESNGTPKPAEQITQIAGISGGPNEQEQSVTITATSSNTDLITSLVVDPSPVPAVAAGTATANLKYKLGHNKFGTAIITLNLVDNAPGGQNSATRKFKIQVNAQNDAPVIADIPDRTVAKSQGANIPLSLTDVETATPFLKVTATSSNQGIVSNGNLLVDAGRTALSVVPVAGVVGSVDITIVVEDRGATDALDPDTAEGATDTETFTLTFSDIRPPVISVNQATQTISEDGVGSFELTLDDDQAEGTLNVVATSDNQTVVPNSNILMSTFGANSEKRNVAILLAKDANAPNGVNITFRVTDNSQLDAVATVKLIVTPVDDTPSLALLGAISDAAITANEDSNPIKDADGKTLEIQVTDAETPADQLQVTASSGNTTVIPNANIVISQVGSKRTLNITPAANQNHADAVVVTIVVKDETGKTDTKTVNVTVNKVNDTPTLDAISSFSIDEDSGTRTVNLAGIGSGAANESQTLSVEVRTRNKEAAADAGASGRVSVPAVSYSSANATGSFTFTPVPNTSGVVEFTVKVTDDNTAGGDAKSIERKFDVTVNTVNDLPTINANSGTPGTIPNQTTVQNTPTAVIPIVVQDVETSSAELLVTVTTVDNTVLIPNTTANLALGGSGANRGLIVTPAANVAGTARIRVTVADQNGGSRSAEFTVTVTASQNPIISSIADITINKGEETDLIPFIVGDGQSAATTLTVTASSDNTGVVQNSTSSIQFGGSGADRVLAIRPVANSSGKARITLTVRDPDNNTSTTSFLLTVLGASPTVSAIADQQIAAGGSTATLPFTISDVETLVALLNVAVSSDNTTFVPNGNVVLGGSGANRTVRVTGAAGQQGEANISIRVTDLDGQVTTRMFKVATSNNAPTISDIASITLTEGGNSGPIAFTISDSETLSGLLTVTATSSNPTLVPASGIVLGGTTGTRTITITPAAGQSASAIITVIVSDGTLTASDSFIVSVSPSSNAAPTISDIASQTTDQGVPTPIQSFTIGDTETAPAGLTVTGSSSNTDLVPVSSIFFGGSGANRTVFIQPTAGKSGFAIITISVRDAGGKTANDTFILTVRAPAVTNKDDFNADGKSDIIYQDSGGFLAAWFMDGINLVSASLLDPTGTGDANWRVVGSGDFNTDNRNDLLFQNTDGTLAVWYMDGVTLTTPTLTTPNHPGDAGWRASATADINKDGKIDILFQHTDGTLAVWYMDGVSLSDASLLNPQHPGDNGWRLVGAGDFNADAKADALFQHTDGSLAAWLLDGVNLTMGALLNPSHPGDANFRVRGVTDLNGDGKADLLFQNSADGSVAAWLMNGLEISTGSFLNPMFPGGTWTIGAP